MLDLLFSFTCGFIGGILVYHFLKSRNFWTDIWAKQLLYQETLHQINLQQKELLTKQNDFNQILRNPVQRGIWGEIQLLRILELSGMTLYHDFIQQHNNEDGLRPDFVINLPHNKKIIIDVKFPLNSEKTDAASLIRSHIKKLKAKDYGKGLNILPTVICFLPAEGLLYDAWAQDPKLFDFALQNDIILATPLNLFGILRTSAHLLANFKFQENAGEFILLIRELQKKGTNLEEIIDELAKSLEKNCLILNKLKISLKDRFEVTLKKIESFEKIN